MKRLLSSLALTGLLAAPFSAFAHETQNFEIGSKTYSFVVGSLNEPMVVDDKSGVELMIQELGAHAEDEAHDDGDSHPAGTPVTGLEKDLKVEIIAGDKKKTLDLSPIYGEPGSYKAVFFPTVQTTLTYRVFGTLNETVIDLSFTCNPAGHPAIPEDTSEVTVSDAVTRTLKRGAFGCPIAKEDLGFPEASVTINQLKNGASTSDPTAQTFSIVALVFGILGFVTGSAAMRKARQTA